MQNIQKLSLVLMKSLNLYIKDGTRIYFDAIVLFNIFCQAYLILVFNVHKFLLTFFVIYIDRQFINLGKVCNPVIPDLICNPGCQFWISMKQESSLGDAICFVVELLRHHLVEIF